MGRRGLKWRADGGKRPHKYGARHPVVDGWRFDSQVEANYYRHLRLRQQAGEVRWFLRQVPIHLTAAKMVVDFLVCEADGTVRFIEVKGYETATFRRNMREVAKLYPGIEIEVVKARAI